MQSCFSNKKTTPKIFKLKRNELQTVIHYFKHRAANSTILVVDYDFSNTPATFLQYYFHSQQSMIFCQQFPALFQSCSLLPSLIDSLKTELQFSKYCTGQLSRPTTWHIFYLSITSLETTIPALYCLKCFSALNQSHNGFASNESP